MADRVERLTNLLALLLETPEPLSLVQIGAELRGQYSDEESARRAAFERDKAALREIGVPIDTEILAGGPYAGQTRYRIDRAKYELGDLDLEPEEVRALQVAIAAVRTGDSLAHDALLKLGGGVGEADTERRSAVIASIPARPELPVIRDAVAARAPIRFAYRGEDRHVEPWGVLLRGGFWYVIGRDVDRGEQRTFRVDRIGSGAGDTARAPGVANIEVGAPRSFERPAGFEPRQAFPADPKQIGHHGEEAVDAVVRVDAARAAAIEREVGSERVIGRGADGSIELTVPASNLPAFRSWVLGLLEHAEVLGPEPVRAHVRDWLADVAAGGAR